jgi:hypothetical protein
MGIPQGVRLRDPIPLATELPITPPFQAGQQRSSQRPDAPSRYRFRLTASVSRIGSRRLRWTNPESTGPADVRYCIR